MRFPFDPKGDLIIVPTQIHGPAGTTVAQLALDTGATVSLVNTEILALVGYQIGKGKTLVPITTGSGTETVPQIVVRRLKALGRHRRNFPILCHNLPPGAIVDGLLGLDFLRARRLRIDFKKGYLTLD